MDTDGHGRGRTGKRSSLHRISESAFRRGCAALATPLETSATSVGFVVKYMSWWRSLLRRPLTIFARLCEASQPSARGRLPLFFDERHVNECPATRLSCHLTT